MSFNPIGDIKKWFNKVKNEAKSGINKIKREGEAAIKRVKHEGETAVNKVSHEADMAVHRVEGAVEDAEHQLEALGEEIAHGLVEGFGDLVELAEQGVLGPALDSIADYAEKTVFDGSAPIPLRTAYLDIEITDAKKLARVLRGMVQDGIPSSKSQWRHIIVELSPTAIAIKPGVPLIAQLVNRIPLEDLERDSLDKILQEVGLK